MTDTLLPIGRFARLARLSIKQLRHYADLGLLPPAWTDPGSGYRYYHPDQARDAMAIGLLRSLDVPLAAIADVLAGEDLPGALGGVRDRLDAELDRRRRALASLERILTDGLPATEVTLRYEEPQRVAVVREVADSPPDIGRVTSACVARLLALDAVRAGPVALTGLFPLDLGESVPVTVAVAVPDGQAAPAGTVADLLPGGRFACAVHVGPYDQIPLTVHALLAWCAEHGRTPGGPLREVYLSDPAVTPPARLVTELLMPMEEPP